MRFRNHHIHWMLNRGNDIVTQAGKAAGPLFSQDQERIFTMESHNHTLLNLEICKDEVLHPRSPKIIVSFYSHSFRTPFLCWVVREYPQILQGIQLKGSLDGITFSQGFSRMYLYSPYGIIRLTYFHAKVSYYWLFTCKNDFQEYLSPPTCKDSFRATRQ